MVHVFQGIGLVIVGIALAYVIGRLLRMITNSLLVESIVTGSIIGLIEWYKFWIVDNFQVLPPLSPEFQLVFGGFVLARIVFLFVQAFPLTRPFARMIGL